MNFVVHCDKHDQDAWFDTLAAAEEARELMSLYCDGKHTLSYLSTNPTTEPRSK